MSRLLKALPLIVFFAGVMLGQGTPVDCTPGTFTFTSATTGTAIANSNSVTPCAAWRVTYNSTGFSALSIRIETSPDNSTWSAVPNTLCSSAVQPPCVIDGANPSTATDNTTFAVRAYGRYVRLNVTTVTGSGTITARLFGYKGLSANAGSGGTGGGGSMTIAGTTNQIAVTGTCNDTAGTCTLKLPNPNVTIDASTGSVQTPGSVSTGVGGANTGAAFMTGVTDAKAQGFSVNDTAGVSILYLMPSSAGAASQVLKDTGVVTCPTLAAGAPAVCHQLAWTFAYQTIDSNGSAVTQRPTVNLISGTNATVTCVDNSGSTRTDCTIAASAGSAAPTFPVNAQTTTYQLLAADFSNCKTIAVASGTFTITAVASGSQPASGACVIIINYGSGVVTFARSGQNINGAAANLTIAAGSASAPNGLFVVSDGTDYIAQPLLGTGGGGTTVSVAPPYLTVSGTVYCGPTLIACTIPTACNSGWTSTVVSSTCTTNSNGDLYFNWVATGAVHLESFTRSVGSTFTLIAGFLTDTMTGTTAGQNGNGIVVTDGTKYIQFQLENEDGASISPRLVVQKWNSTTSASTNYSTAISSTAISAKIGQFFWMKLVLDSTNLTWSYSVNGINFTQVTQQAKGDFLGTITKAGVGAYTFTGSAMSLVSLSGI
jgi:hypothetical protein